MAIEVKMAKKTKTEETYRDKLLSCRVTDDEHEAVRKHSHDQYMSKSAYLYLALREKLQREGRR